MKSAIHKTKNIGLTRNKNLLFSDGMLIFIFYCLFYWQFIEYYHNYLNFYPLYFWTDDSYIVYV